MANKDIFCSSPWYDLHVYWDGSLGFCAQEDHKIYPEHEKPKYNLKNMSIREWYNSLPMREVRSMMFKDTRSTICQRCWGEEDVDGTSRRYRCNQKSVIFTRQNFKESYEQSPGYDHFEHSRLNQGDTPLVPIDLHLDLGNHCNLACKMCAPRASSNIAAQYVRWGMKDAEKYIGSDWTRDEEVWQRVLKEIVEIPNLHNIHFMGGETLITKRFEDFVDYMIEHKKFDLNFSFTSNGTTFNERLLDKLKLFQRVGIEISIETIDEHNAYQRQGTDTNLVLENIDRYVSYCNNTSITLTIRPAISALTIGYYAPLLKYCLDRKLIVKSLLVYYPTYLDIRVLPLSIRQQYKQSFETLLVEYDLENINTNTDYNESDPHELRRSIKNQIIQCLNMLDAPDINNQDRLLTELVSWCRRWDTVYKFDALTMYPELTEEFVKRGY